MWKNIADAPNFDRGQKVQNLASIFNPLVFEPALL